MTDLPDYLAYIDRNDFVKRIENIRSLLVSNNPFSSIGIISGKLKLDADNDRIILNLSFLDSDIKKLQDRIDKANENIKRYKRDIAILQGEEIPVDKIEQYEAEEKAKVEAEKQAEQKKNNTVIGVIVLAIVAFIIYVLKKKSK
ncbi:MAG: FeoB-associated Cys-rich membrane protein [Prevotellaceae bacterium]|jgi:seryl-tRNA synthetase|nr:FeoB-associated Cys-rich membrane protein [Prevotellaceae bacterium]